MLGMSGTFVGVVGIALAASLAHASFSNPWHEPSAIPEWSAGQTVVSERKSDRLAIPAPALARSSVAEVEWIGTGPLGLVLRGSAGEVLYFSDPKTNTTIYAKNADLPMLTVKPKGLPPLVQQPTERREGKETPSAKRKGSPVGCSNPLSPLVKSDATPPPGLCVVMHGNERPLS